MTSLSRPRCVISGRVILVKRHACAKGHDRSSGTPSPAQPPQGDTWIDDHHTNEDIALALGTALSQALGSKRGINRFGNFAAPLDEALVSVVLDLSGRPYLGYDLAFQTENIGRYEVQLVEHFFQSLANTSGMTLHIRQVGIWVAGQGRRAGAVGAHM